MEAAVAQAVAVEVDLEVVAMAAAATVEVGWAVVAEVAIWEAVEEDVVRVG